MTSNKLQEFAERKTREALDAALPPYVTDAEHSTGDLEAIGNDWSRRLFDGDFYLSPPPNPRRPACSVVFVQSHDGNTGAGDPSRLGGGQTDKHVIYEGLSRAAADAVLAGAETVRGGDILLSVWHPELVSLRQSLGKPRHPAQIVATLRGLDFDRGLLFNVPAVPVILLTIGACAATMREGLASRPWITPIVMTRPDDLPTAFGELRARGIERISAIGGRQVAAQLFDAGLVQDLYLTTAPREGGEPNTPLYPTPLDKRVVVRKHGSGAESGVTFEHFRILERS